MNVSATRIREQTGIPFHPEAELAIMDLDALDRYHDALLSCIENADHFGYSDAPYREEAERVAVRLKAAGWAT